MRHPIVAVTAAVSLGLAGTALARSADKAAPGEVAVSVVNGRMTFTPKRFSTPEYLAEAQARRDAKAQRRQAARAAREHGVAVANGRMSFAPKPAASAFAITDQ